ncbi:alpha/beta fold hydrolase [Kutzneria kofuensis]|uniref:Pimeloyl-ACP methyl ester carboxylesterase n=1 Tax=Kutzneria kofuensis TaxID=103725 RepID=A0A7W9NLT1_9PSEU|nr:alpha/beta fold hydrolase [Kutzneria kofuensis]MBB5897380.1 pimeloyl-ACP methyl ester carboxylesterase [Kutzneria kofuensis]
MPDFRSFDGLRIAYRELGEGRPVVLLHGMMGLGSQWIDQGPAAAIAERGHRVILPDLRGHGDSARPHDPTGYPPDALADDMLALVEHLGLDDYDLGGYSLGGRVTLRMLVRGARPRRAVIAGQGLDAIEGVTSRTGGYRSVLTSILDGGELDPAGQRTARWLDQLGADPYALLHVLDTHVATPIEDLGRVKVPTLVLVGDGDDGHASAVDLAAALPESRYVRVPGDHWSAFTGPDFAAAILDWLAY